MAEENGRKEADERGEDQEEAKRDRGGGMLFPAIIILVIGAWCVKDGFITPDATSSPTFNKVGAVVLGIGGLAMLVYELLRPRTGAPVEEEPKE